MSRDYAKKPKKRASGARRKPSAKRRPADRRRLPGWAWLLTGVAVSSFVYFLWYLQQQGTGPRQPDPARTEAAREKPRPDPVEAEPVPTESLSVETDYSFHETLTNKEVEVPSDALQGTTSSQKYIMPCGSFRDVNGADTMKARLALLGMQADIKMIDGSNGRWHRVQIGPYLSKRAAERDRHQLQNQGMNDCRIWPLAAQ